MSFISVILYPLSTTMSKQIIIREKELSLRKQCIQDIPDHKTQITHINMLFLDDHDSHYKREIQKKIYNYKKQDERKKRKSCLSFDAILGKVISSKLICSYCMESVFILYKHAYDPKQWTLDRIDNNIGHTYENCVISCYSCNKEKRIQSDLHFRQGKQITFIQIGK
jgi:hypothetical protein